MKSKSKAVSKPVQSSDTPSTSAMLYEMEERLNHRMDAGFHKIQSEVHRVALLVEEQNARNKYVMDGYAQIYELLLRNHY